MLGEGNYAQVKLSKEKSTGHMWAIKIINKKKLEVRCPTRSRRWQIAPCSGRAVQRGSALTVVSPLALVQPGDEEMLAPEVEVLREVSHPNIIHLYKYVGPSAVAAGPSLRAQRCGGAGCSTPSTRCSWCSSW